MSWHKIPLKNLGQIIGGGTPSTKEPLNFGADYPWITPKDLSRQGQRYIDHGERGISTEGLTRSSAKLLPAGSVIVSSRAPIGLTAIATVPVTTNQGCRSFVPGRDADSLFMYYLLGSMTDQMESLANGSTFKEISGSTLAAIEVSVPEIEEQRAIAATLGALDDKIESNRRAVDIAENLGDQLFATAVDGAAALADVATLTMGSSPPGDSYNECGDGLPFYQGIRDFGRRYPGHRVWTTNAIRLAQEGDSLVSVRAPVGELNRSLETCCIGRGVAAVRSTHPSTVFYALRAADSLWEPFQQEGTVFGAINKSDLSSARLPWPRAAALASLEGTLSAIDSKIRSLSLESEHLANLRDSLLPVLLSGRVRVPAIREVVQEVAT